MLRRDWGESGSILFWMVLWIGLPNRYAFGTDAIDLGVTVFIGIVFVASIFATIAGERGLRRRVMMSAALLMALGIALSLTKIVHMVIYEPSKVDGIKLIETSVLIWVSTVVVFAIIYHLLGDRDFAFPRADDQRAARLHFMDYIFLAFTTGTAFSPTDTSPLTTRARMLMMVQAMISLIVVAIAAARAINVLPS